jgi:molybdate transport repressor ModE-like protein
MSTHDAPPDLETIRILLEVSRRGSIQAAARRMEVSRATARRRIEELEAAVGAPLLHRGAQGARLTPAGEVLVLRGQQVVHDARRAMAEARAAASEATGLVRISMPIGMPGAMVVAGLRGMLADQGGLRVRLVEHVDPAAASLDASDLVFHVGPPPPDNTWFSRVLAQVRVRLVASADYLAERGTPQCAADLADHRLLIWLSPGADAHSLPLVDGGQLPAVPALASANPSLLRRLASAGAGIAFVPENEMDDDPSIGPLVTLLADEIGRDVAFRVSSPLPSRVDRRAAEVVRWVLAALGALAPG